MTTTPHQPLPEPPLSQAQHPHHTPHHSPPMAYTFPPTKTAQTLFPASHPHNPVHDHTSPLIPTLPATKLPLPFPLPSLNLLRNTAIVERRRNTLAQSPQVPHVKLTEEVPPPSKACAKSQVLYQKYPPRHHPRPRETNEKEAKIHTALPLPTMITTVVSGATCLSHPLRLLLSHQEILIHNLPSSLGMDMGT